MSNNRICNLKALRGIGLRLVLLLLLFNNTSARAGKQTTQGDALLALVESFYEAYEKKDVDAFVALWAAQAPTTAERRQQMQKLFASARKIEIKRFNARSFKVNGAEARVGVELEVVAAEAVKDDQIVNRGLVKRVFHCRKQNEEWKVWQEESAQEDFAARLVAPPTDEERQKMLAEEPEFLDQELPMLLNQLGSKYFNSSPPDFARAITIYLIAHSAALQVNDKSRAATSLRYIGRAYSRQKAYSEAEEYYGRSLAVSRELNDNQATAETLFYLAGVYTDRGEYPLARQKYEESLGLRDPLKHQANIAMARHSIGGLYYRQGDFDAALYEYQKSLDWYEQIREKDNNQQHNFARLLTNIGLVYSEQGNYAKALSYYEKSRKIEQDIGREVQGLLQDIGAIYRKQGDYENALKNYRADLERSQRRRDEGFVAQALTNIGLVYLAQGVHDQASEYFLQALELSEKIKVPRRISQARDLVGYTLYLQKKYDQALAQCQSSLSIRQELGDMEGMADTRHNIALVYAEQGNFSRALEYAEPAGALAKEIGKRESIWLIYSTLGRVYLAINRPDKAKTAFEDAIKAVEEMRANVAGGEQQAQSFFQNKTSPYVEMAELLLAQNKKEEALAYAERAKARALLDVLQSGKVNVTKAMTAEEQGREQKLRSEMVSLNTRLARASRDDKKKIAELRDQAKLHYEDFQVELYAAHPELKAQRGESPPLTLAQAGELLPDDKTALLSFIVAKERTLLFTLTKPKLSDEAHLSAYSLPIKREELAQSVSRFREKLSARDLEFKAESQKLYQQILQSAQPQLRGVTRLVVVPDGALWELPFQALMTERGNYLWQDCAIAYAPSLTVLREMVQARRGRQGSSSSSALLAVGDPKLGKDAIERYKTSMGKPLEQIPEAAEQVRRLSRFYDSRRSKVYTGAAATEAQVKAKAGEYDVLHLATHGILNDRSPMYSHIVLAQQTGEADNRNAKEAGQDGREEDGLLEAWEIMKMDLKADLAVLSACQTARGRVSAGEGMIGLTWALFVAGVPAMVASQWEVRADSTAELMVEFHRQLRQPQKAAKTASAEALRRAALKLMKSQDYDHPYFWAGFVVMGDGFDDRAGNAGRKAKLRKRSDEVAASR